MELPELATHIASPEDALLAMVTGWLAHIGPITGGELDDLQGMAAPPKSRRRCCGLEAAGAILRGKFTGSDAAGNDARKREWCDRRLLAGYIA